MDAEAFGTLPADRLTIAAPRRRVLRALGGLALGAAGVALTHDDAAARRRRRRRGDGNRGTVTIGGNLGDCGADCDFNDQF